MSNKDFDRAQGYAPRAAKAEDSQSTSLDTSDLSPSALMEQLDIFTSIPKLNTKNPEHLTNLTGIYDLLPKWTPWQQKVEQTSAVITRNISHLKGVKLEIQIKAATLQNGKVRFPGIMEDNIEAALAYLASQGGAPADRVKSGASNSVGVRFTLNQLRTVCEKVLGKKYSIDDIKQSLQILNESHLNVSPSNGDETLSFRATRLPYLVIHTRAAYEKARDRGADTHCYAEFHPLFSLDVRRGLYNLHDLQLQGALKTEIGQQILRILSIYWRQAGVETPYHFSAIRFLEGTPYGVSTTNNSRNWSKIREGVEDLKAAGVLSRSVEDIHYNPPIPGKRKSIRDITFTLYATEDHQKRMIKLNKLKNDQTAMGLD